MRRLFDLDQARAGKSRFGVARSGHPGDGSISSSADWREAEAMDERAKPTTKAQELRAFLFLSVVLAPVLAVAVVSGYGFLVWAVQLVTGPPGAKF
jgi:nitrate reductase NapE